MATTLDDGGFDPAESPRPLSDRNASPAALDAAGAAVGRGEGPAVTATFDAIYGVGRDWWADDAEFDEFLAGVAATRRERG